MRERLERSLAGLGAAHVAVLQRQAKVLAFIEEQHRRFEIEQEHRELSSMADLHERVMSLVRRGDYAALTTREARIAARMIGAFEPREHAALLRARPEVASTFVEEFFRRWDDMETLRNRSSFAELVVKQTHLLPFMQLAPRGQLVTAEGPRLVASAAPRANLANIAPWLRAQGLAPRWAFTGHVVALVVIWSLFERGFDAVWHELSEHIDVAGLILPPLTQDNGQWFFTTPPSTRSGSTPARAMVVSTILHVFFEANRALPESLVTGLLDSDFGDPRVPPESAGWQRVRSHAPTAYAKFLEDLIREDLTLFFDHAMHDDARRNFWLLYLKAIRRTVCVLAPATYDMLTRQLGGAQGELRAALTRVRKFAGTASVNAFCLYFDHLVVVEFSQKPNAAYLYRRSDFDRRIEPRLANNTIGTEKDLKLGKPLDKITHHVNWERRAHAILHEHGVQRWPQM